MAKKRRKLGDVESRIAALEAALRDSSSGSSSGESSDDDVEVRKGGAVIASLASERIPALPAHLLPRCTSAPAPRKGPSPLAAEAQALVDRFLATEKRKGVPFACRLCAFQGESLEAWKAHCDTKLHCAATTLFKRRSFCQECRVQCTSPAELETHRRSKKHQERLRDIGQER